MQLATSVQPTARRQQRLTVAAAALAVLCVLLLPPLVSRVFGGVVPVDSETETELTGLAREVARMPGTTEFGGTVVVTITPEMRAPPTTASEQVLPSESAGHLVPLGVSGLLPLTPAVAPEAMQELAADLSARDHVFANLGPLVVGCLPEWHDPPRECTPLLLTRHATGYYRYPVTWGSSSFLEAGSAMQAEVFDVLGGRLVVGGLTGTETELVEVLVDGGDVVTAFTTPSASPGDTVWWAVISGPAVRATAHDAAGNFLAAVDLAE
jgi:hypothetical protein